MTDYRESHERRDYEGNHEMTDYKGSHEVCGHNEKWWLLNNAQ